MIVKSIGHHNNYYNNRKKVPKKYPLPNNKTILGIITNVVSNKFLKYILIFTFEIRQSLPITLLLHLAGTIKGVLYYTKSSQK